MGIFCWGTRKLYRATGGTRPFKGADAHETLVINKKCQPNYGKPGIEKLTPQALDLMKKMLDPSSKTRAGCSEALQHMFFKMSDKEHDVNYTLLLNDLSVLSVSKKEKENEERSMK